MAMGKWHWENGSGDGEAGRKVKKGMEECVLEKWVRDGW